MFLSVFTPTHNPEFLQTLHTSILKQNKDIQYEWVIVTNGKIRPTDIPAEINDNPNVRIIHSDLTGIGALKKFACNNCRGDMFIEIDHDDFIASNTFTELVDVAIKTPNGFYYSDFVNLLSDGRCQTFSRAHGWQVYVATLDGTTYKVCKAFPPSARALSQIYYSPNHIRAWSRYAYELTGGHDSRLTIADDHDLLCRTYIAGIPFVLIPKPLYIYRRHPSNSFVTMGTELKIKHTENTDKYLYPLIAAECAREQREIVDITGDMLANGGINRLDYTDSSIGRISAYNFLHYVPPNKIVGTMNELYRVLVPGGWLLTQTPAIEDADGLQGEGTLQDPCIKSYWSANNFKYYCNKELAATVDGLNVRYQLVSCKTEYPSPEHVRSKTPYIYASMSALKGQIQPGECKI